jgi:hypothetical protein
MKPEKSVSYYLRLLFSVVKNFIRHLQGNSLSFLGDQIKKFTQNFTIVSESGKPIEYNLLHTMSIFFPLTYCLYNAVALFFVKNYY